MDEKKESDLNCSEKINVKKNESLGEEGFKPKEGEDGVENTVVFGEVNGSEKGNGDGCSDKVVGVLCGEINPDDIFRDDSDASSGSTFSDPCYWEESAYIRRCEQKWEDGEELSASFETDPKWRRRRAGKTTNISLSDESDGEVTSFKRLKKLD